MHADIPAAVRDLLATLDLWADLSPSYRTHLVDAAHAPSPMRAAIVVELPGEQFVLGPLCVECVPMVAARVAEWTALYPLATAEVAHWSAVAVLRDRRWVPKGGR